MEEFKFTVKIEAKDNEQARKILTAMFDIKKNMTTETLLFFAKKIKEDPELIEKARGFLL